MSEVSGRLDAVLDAAYICFARHGLRRATMDDIAGEVGLSRPTLYLSVKNKDEAFRLVAQRMLDRSLAAATAAAQRRGGTADRVIAVLECKLGLAAQLHRDSPAHAADFLVDGARRLGTMIDDHIAALTGIVAEILRERTTPREAGELAAALIALTYGLEREIDDLRSAGRQLRRTVTLVVIGLEHS
ncbi:helix-turn-helix domain-containing protein [Nocardia sp. NPDC051833]|uniref:TetR/AcrR family transcriptional regulator n=1 Tax=Nocardia sp. NPDC051833 TaxID=3155674 RepID=UPI00342C7288